MISALGVPSAAKCAAKRPSDRAKARKSSGVPSGAVAQLNLVLDENVVADVGVPTDAGTRQHVGEGPDAAAGTDVRALHQGVAVDEGGLGVAHGPAR